MAAVEAAVIVMGSYGSTLDPIRAGGGVGGGGVGGDSVRGWLSHGLPPSLPSSQSAVLSLKSQNPGNPNQNRIIDINDFFNFFWLASKPNYRH